MILEQLIKRFLEHRHRGASDGVPIASEGLERLNLLKFIPTSAPSSPKEGDVYYDSTAKKLKFYNGTAWETITSA